ncbi:hypothetical protein [Nocardia australiensis]|uniref:hypothetical protein n=1 Tax=Nocardia australiensis TaxID=2887191 RepID=UPI001D13756E|nr:hypothetical protein [Nocardia australiensis]
MNMVGGEGQSLTVIPDSVRDIGKYVGEYFEIIRQLTRQMANVQRESMVEQGWTREINTFLYEFVKSIPRDIEPQAWVRIVVSDQSIDRSESQTDALRLDGEAVRYAPTYICELWPTLLATTWELLGSLEARYRTGFNADEITAALASMTEAVDGALRA